MSIELHSYNTVKDVILYLRISKSKWYEIVAEGLPPSLYIGASPRWTFEDIMSWLMAQTEKAKKKDKA
jgi:predicted DNA-binding transcriptional regulator AlpA